MAQDQWKPPSYATEWIPPSYAEPTEVETTPSPEVVPPIQAAEQPGMFSRAWEWSNKGLLGHDPSMEEWMNTPAYAAKEQGLNILTSPLGMVGELGVGLRMLNNMRLPSRLRNIPMSGEIKLPLGPTQHTMEPMIRQRLLTSGLQPPKVTDPLLLPETTSRNFIAPESGMALESNMPTDMVNPALSAEVASSNRMPIDGATRFSPVNALTPPDNVHWQNIRKLRRLGVDMSAVGRMDKSQVAALANSLEEAPGIPTASRFTRGVDDTRMGMNPRQDITPSSMRPSNQGPSVEVAELTNRVRSKSNPSGIPLNIPPDPAKALSAWDKTNNFAKTMLTSYDIAAPGRQGKQLIHSTKFWTSFDDMFKSMGSQKAFDSIMGAIKERPLFIGPKGQSVAERAGLDLPDILNVQEERFAKGLAQKIPGVKMSERAYTGFLNKLRADHFEMLVEKYTKVKGSPLDDKELYDLAHTVNTATGRGDLGRYQKHAEFLTKHFFAPKFVASRLRILDPRYYLSPSISPYARKEALKNLGAMIGASMVQNSLYALAGGVTGTSIVNSEFGKSAFGDVKMDPNAGAQQPLVAGAKMMYGLYDMYQKGNLEEYLKYGDKNAPLTVLSEFAMQRANPIESFILGMMRGTDMDTKDFEFKKGVINRMFPIVAQDISDIINEDPNLLPLIIPAMMGDSMNVYTK